MSSSTSTPTATHFVTVLRAVATKAAVHSTSAAATATAKATSSSSAAEKITKLENKLAYDENVIVGLSLMLTAAILTIIMIIVFSCRYRRRVKAAASKRAAPLGGSTFGMQQSVPQQQGFPQRPARSSYGGPQRRFDQHGVEMI